jgi:heptosyltransferase-1
VRVVGFERALLREPMAGMLYTETGGSDAAHVIRKNLSLLRTLGIQSSTLEFPLENRRPQIADDVRRRLGISETDRFAIINPGAAWPNKRWPPVYFAEVAVALKARQGLPSVVMWGPGEEQLAQTVVDASQGSAAISPRTTIADLVSLTRAASLMVSGDTGPLHIAGAMGTPIVGIYGPTNPARNGPWAASDMWISQFQNCECQYRRQCHAQRWCMLEISPRDVNDVIDRSLSTPPSRGHAGRG